MLRSSDEGVRFRHRRQLLLTLTVNRSPSVLLLLLQTRLCPLIFPAAEDSDGHMTILPSALICSSAPLLPQQSIAFPFRQNKPPLLWPTKGAGYADELPMLSTICLRRSAVPSEAPENTPGLSDHFWAAVDKRLNISPGRRPVLLGTHSTQVVCCCWFKLSGAPWRSDNYHCASVAVISAARHFTRCV